MKKVDASLTTSAETIEAIILNDNEYEAHKEDLAGWSMLRNPETGEILAVPPEGTDVADFLAHHQKH